MEEQENKDNKIDEAKLKKAKIKNNINLNPQFKQRYSFTRGGKTKRA